jgi:thiol-disulfide isomerase/thioredoxin
MTRCAPTGLLLLATLVACGERTEQSRSSAFRPIDVGAPAPGYAVRVFGGDSLHVGPGAAAPLTLLNIWATWCIPCRHEFPELERLYTTYGGKGLAVVGVSVDAGGTDDRVTRTARDLGGTFPIARDPDGRIQDVFRAIGVPETFLIGRDGTLLWRHPGDISSQVADLERVITSQLKQTP